MTLLCQYFDPFCGVCEFCCEFKMFFCLKSHDMMCDCVIFVILMIVEKSETSFKIWDLFHINLEIKF